VGGPVAAVPGTRCVNSGLWSHTPACQRGDRARGFPSDPSPTNTNGSIVAKYDDPGFHSIGSGGTFCYPPCIERKAQKSIGLDEAIFAVYEAKRLAQLAQGVGTQTDMAFIRRGFPAVVLGPAQPRSSAGFTIDESRSRRRTERRSASCWTGRFLQVGRRYHNEPDEDREIGTLMDTNEH
jgi:hypothetical protein